MIIQVIKFKTTLSENEVIAIAKERAPEFRKLTGLLQKYYVKTDPPGQYAGIYFWDSVESLNSYRESELAASIPKAYKVVGQPDITTFESVFELRENAGEGFTAH